MDNLNTTQDKNIDKTISVELIKIRVHFSLSMSWIEEFINTKQHILWSWKLSANGLIDVIQEGSQHHHFQGNSQVLNTDTLISYVTFSQCSTTI